VITPIHDPPNTGRLVSARPVPTGDSTDQTGAWIAGVILDALGASSAGAPIDPRLTAQLERYQAAGTRALADDELAGDGWLSLRIAIEPQHAARHLVRVVRPILLQLPAEGWWWLLKADPWGTHLRLRVRLRGEDAARRAQLLRERLALAAPEFTVTTVPYEAELALFGGATGLDLAHRFSQLDSEFVVVWLAHGGSRSRGRFLDGGLSVMLLDQMLSASGLDAFEKWDVWRKVRGLRNQLSGAELRIDEILPQLRRVLGARSAVAGLYGDERAALITDHVVRLRDCGRGLAAAQAGGTLERGIRQLLVPMVLFHWNRAGFSLPAQARLAAALVAATEPIER
jgi:thiopeptide-type bacteriocin biosynthesis protein